MLTLKKKKTVQQDFPQGTDRSWVPPDCPYITAKPWDISAENEKKTQSLLLDFLQTAHLTEGNQTGSHSTL